MNFKWGDKVVCIDDNGLREVMRKGQLLTISGVPEEGIVSLQEVDGWFAKIRFQPAKNYYLNEFERNIRPVT